MLVQGINVGTVGEFRLNVPFHDKIPTTTIDGVLCSVECEVVQRGSLKGTGLGGINTLQLYLSSGLSKKQHDEDYDSGVMLITLHASGYPKIIVPETYIDRFPNPINVPYYQPVLTVSLGPWAMSTDFTRLRGEVSDIVQQLTGVDNNTTEDPIEVSINGYELEGSVSQALHETILVGREANRKRSDSNLDKIARLEAQVADLKMENVTLQEWLSHGKVI